MNKFVPCPCCGNSDAERVSQIVQRPPVFITIPVPLESGFDGTVAVYDPLIRMLAMPGPVRPPRNPLYLTCLAYFLDEAQLVLELMTLGTGIGLLLSGDRGSLAVVMVFLGALVIAKLLMPLVLLLAESDLERWILFQQRFHGQSLEAVNRRRQYIWSTKLWYCPECGMVFHEDHPVWTEPSDLYNFLNVMEGA